jgi:BNR repeat-like domain
VAVVLAVGRGGNEGDGSGEADVGGVEADVGGAQAELAEQTENTRGRQEAFQHARDTGKLGLTGPLRLSPAPGWAGQRLWNKKADDWEPAVAGRPDSSRVYMLTTRYGAKPACGNCPEPAIRLRISRDAGVHWTHSRYLCTCRGSKHQYDPEIEMAADGSLYAAWLDGFDPGVSFARSDDGGRTWTKPVAVDKHLAWSDKPIVAISDDGQDVYIAFNGPSAGDGWVAVSHDRGRHFGQPVALQRNSRYHFAGGGVVLSDGTIAFGQTAYKQESDGPVRILATTSDDGGKTWRNVRVDVVQKQPDCVSKGCPPDFYGPEAAMAGDSNGDLVIAYNGAARPNGPQRAYSRRSTDGGVHWSDRTPLSPKKADAAFPAAIGGQGGDIRAWYMDTRKGGDDRWNVWYRESADGGQSWSLAERISDARHGTSYIKPGGFQEPYGDYGELAIVAEGATFAAWGEGSSYFGPGGTWFNRTR